MNRRSIASRIKPPVIPSIFFRGTSALSADRSLSELGKSRRSRPGCRRGRLDPPRSGTGVTIRSRPSPGARAAQPGVRPAPRCDRIRSPWTVRARYAVHVLSAMSFQPRDGRGAKWSVSQITSRLAYSFIYGARHPPSSPRRPSDQDTHLVVSLRPRHPQSSPRAAGRPMLLSAAGNIFDENVVDRLDPRHRIDHAVQDSRRPTRCAGGPGCTQGQGLAPRQQCRRPGLLLAGRSVVERARPTGGQHALHRKATTALPCAGLAAKRFVGFALSQPRVRRAVALAAKLDDHGYGCL